MTIFDALKYQISYPPTKEELGAIPLDIYTQFFKYGIMLSGVGKYDKVVKIEINKVGEISSIRCNWLRHNPQTFNFSERTINDFRKLIANYDNI